MPPIQDGCLADVVKLSVLRRLEHYRDCGSLLPTIEIAVSQFVGRIKLSYRTDQRTPHRTQSQAMEPMLHQTILDLEDGTWRALMETGAALLPFLGPDITMFFPMGLKISNKTEPNIDQVMNSEAFVPWRRYRLSEVEVVSLGPEAAIITYRVNATRQHITDDDDERQDEFQALISSVWKKDPEAGKWLMVFHQQTPYEDINI